jgi:enoyl-[acyl-carrier protein] reductase II
MENRVIKLLSIHYPIIQAGMVWCSGWELASAVSNAGALGLIGAGSMTPDILQQHIKKTKAATSKPFGVNIPLLYSQVEKNIDIIIEEKVPIVFTSAGNPATWTKKLKDNKIIVVHVVSNVKFAKKAEDAGADAIVAEGVEAGGHNGREETTTMVLIPLIVQNTSIPVIAAGGIASGKAMLAAMALGAEGVQVGSRFVASNECSAHSNFKHKIVDTSDGGTCLALKQISMVRLLKNDFAKKIEEADIHCASKEELLNLLGKGRSRLGMFDGDLTEGELEIGQVAALINNIKPAAEIVLELINEYNSTLNSIYRINN